MLYGNYCFNSRILISWLKRGDNVLVNKLHFDEKKREIKPKDNQETSAIFGTRDTGQRQIKQQIHHRKLKG